MVFETTEELNALEPRRGEAKVGFSRGAGAWCGWSGTSTLKSLFKPSHVHRPSGWQAGDKIMPHTPKVIPGQQGAPDLWEKATEARESPGMARASVSSSAGDRCASVQPVAGATEETFLSWKLVVTLGQDLARCLWLCNLWQAPCWLDLGPCS